MPGSRSHCGCRDMVEPLQSSDPHGVARRKRGCELLVEGGKRGMEGGRRGGVRWE